MISTTERSEVITPTIASLITLAMVVVFFLALLIGVATVLVFLYYRGKDLVTRGIPAVHWPRAKR